MLNCDVDECVLKLDGQSVFALAERSRSGVVKEEAQGVRCRNFRGISNSWKYPCPAGEAFNPAIHLLEADFARAWKP